MPNVLDEHHQFNNKKKPMATFITMEGEVADEFALRTRWLSKREKRALTEYGPQTNEGESSC